MPNCAPLGDQQEGGMEQAEKEKALKETVNLVYPNKSDAVPEEVHEVFHD